MKNIRGPKSGPKEYIKRNRKQSAIKIILSRPFTVWPVFLYYIAWITPENGKTNWIYVSKYNVYFDGTYKDLSESFALGRIHGWDYAVDGHTLDLNRARWQDNNQEKLLEFLKLYTDAFIPPVPKGILKIPTII